MTKKNITELILIICIVLFTVYGSLTTDVNQLIINNCLFTANYMTYNLDSSNYNLQFDKNTLAINIVDKESSEIVYKSGDIQEDTEEFDNGLNTMWEAFLRSGVSVSINNERDSLPYALANSKSVAVKQIANGICASVKIDDVKLSFDLIITLKNNVLDIEIPYSSIKEDSKGKNKLLSISLYPYFCGSKGIINGDNNFIFIPDGSGAIIDLSKQTLAKFSYCNKIYNDDIGIISNEAHKKYGDNLSPERIMIPAFGKVVSGRGFISHIESGAEYASINAYVSSIVTDYNFVYPTYFYRESYSKPIDNKGGAKNIYQEDKNQFNIKHRYMLLDESNATLSGMANVYRDNLINTGILSDKILTTNDVPLRLDFLMAEQKANIIGKTTQLMTDVNFVKSVFDRIKNQNIENLHSTLYGYSIGGLSNSNMLQFGFENKTGSKNDYIDLINYSKNNDISLGFSVNYTKAYADAIGHFKKDIAITLGEKYATMPDRNLWLNNAEKTYDDYVLFHNNATNNFANKDLDCIEKYNINNLQIDDFGEILLSAYDKNPQTRSSSIEFSRDLLKKYTTNVILKSPNEYLWDKTKEFTSVPTTSSNYMIALDNVPFLQMVTNGYINSFSRPINLNYNYTDTILNLIEYGTYPSFYLTEESSMLLYQTNSFNVFTSKYSTWEDIVLDIYKKVENALKDTVGQKYISREEVEKNLIKCQYENGLTIYINYNTTDKFIDGINIPHKNYLVVN